MKNFLSILFWRLFGTSKPDKNGVKACTWEAQQIINQKQNGN